MRALSSCAMPGPLLSGCAEHGSDTRSGTPKPVGELWDLDVMCTWLFRATGPHLAFKAVAKAVRFLALWQHPTSCTHLWGLIHSAGIFLYTVYLVTCDACSPLQGFEGSRMFWSMAWYLWLFAVGSCLTCGHFSQINTGHGFSKPATYTKPFCRRNILDSCIGISLLWHNSGDALIHQPSPKSRKACQAQVGLNEMDSLERECVVCLLRRWQENLRK